MPDRAKDAAQSVCNFCTESGVPIEPGVAPLGAPSDGDGRPRAPATHRIAYTPSL